MSEEREANFEGEGRSTPKFNLGLSTLQSLHNIKNLMASASTIFLEHEPNLDPLEAERKSTSLRIRLVRQLFVSASPLLTKEKYKDWKKTMDKKTRDLLKKIKYDQFYSNYKIVFHKIGLFEEGVNDLIEDYTLEILDKISEEGYFMPQKGESDMF